MMGLITFLVKKTWGISTVIPKSLCTVTVPAFWKKKYLFYFCESSINDGKSPPVCHVWTFLGYDETPFVAYSIAILLMSRPLCVSQCIAPILLDYDNNMELKEKLEPLSQVFIEIHMMADVQILKCKEIASDGAAGRSNRKKEGGRGRESMKHSFVNVFTLQFGRQN